MFASRLSVEPLPSASTQATDGPFLDWLTRALNARLVEIDRERGAIRAALAALEPTRPRKKAPAIADQVLAAVRRAPGIRGTMLSLELGVAQDCVDHELAALQRAGRVTRDRLGWSLVDADDADA